MRGDTPIKRMAERGMGGPLHQTTGFDAEFEQKARELITLTQGCNVPQLLTLRRAVLAESGATRWASTSQVKVIFNVVLSAKLQGLGDAVLREAQGDDFESLLPHPAPDYREGRREEDRETLAHAVIQALMGRLHMNAEGASPPFESTAPGAGPPPSCNNAQTRGTAAPGVS